MPEINHVSPKAGDPLLLVGTMKGAFVLRSDPSRKNWEVGGPYFPGRAIYAMAYDSRDGRNLLWAAVNSSYWGSYLSTSKDFGKNWTEPETYGVKFPEDTENSVKQIWQIVPGNAAEPDTLYCGVEPAALFRSDDAGQTWSLVKGLYDHPHRPQWQPGGGGLCLHTILPDPNNKDRMHIAISTGGVYRTDDGGKNWKFATRVFALSSYLPISGTRSLANACTRSSVIRQTQNAFSSKTTGGSIAAMMGAIHGRTLLMGCHRISASHWK